MSYTAHTARDSSLDFLSTFRFHDYEFDVLNNNDLSLFLFPSLSIPFVPFVHSSCAARPSFSPFHLIPSASPLSFPSYLDILLTLFDLTRTLYSQSRRARVSDFKFFFSFILFPFSILFSIASIFLFLFFTISQFATILI